MFNYTINNEPIRDIAPLLALTNNPSIEEMSVMAESKLPNPNRVCQARLKELLHYDPETGKWTWLIAKAPNAKVGDIAGYINGHGYRYIKIDDKQYKSSRLAWLYQEGYFPEYDIDHKDRVKNNDVWKNLRHATRSCNMKNIGIRSNNTSGITGVYRRKDGNKWAAYIGARENKINLGNFTNFTDAVRARYEAEKKYNYLSCQTNSPAFNYLEHYGEFEEALQDGAGNAETDGFE